MIGEKVPSAGQASSASGERGQTGPCNESYDYAMLSEDVILVNPSSKKIAVTSSHGEFSRADSPSLAAFFPHSASLVV